MSDEEEKCECPDGLPPWLATFADLMSLLMCFFVLLLSFSEMDAMKFKRLAGSMAQAFGIQSKLNVLDPPKGTSIIAKEFSPGTPAPTPINEIWQHTEDITKSSLDVECSEEFDIEQGDVNQESGAKLRIRQKLEEMVNNTKDEATELAQSLSEQIGAGEIEIETEGLKIIIRIREQGSFKSASAELAGNYFEVMEEIRAVLRSKSGKILVQGHTDDIPIATARFRSNWELSSGRAVSVAHELMYQGEINAKRFEVSGFSDTKPLVDNDSSANRERNRRVEIILQKGLDDELNKEDVETLKDSGQDIIRDLDLDPKYLFTLDAEEIF